MKLLGLGAAAGFAYFHSRNQNLSRIRMLENSAGVRRNSICLVYPNADSEAYGIISFQQDSYESETKVVANLRNLNPNSLHGMTIHEHGDLSNGVESLGKPYNPHPVEASDELYRFVGDLGSVKTDERGNGYAAFKHPFISLHGDKSIVGRSCVVYEEENNSQTGQNSSKMLAAGIIGLSNEFKNLPPA